MLSGISSGKTLWHRGGGGSCVNTSTTNFTGTPHPHPCLLTEPFPIEQHHCPALTVWAEAVKVMVTQCPGPATHWCWKLYPSPRRNGHFITHSSQYQVPARKHWIAGYVWMWFLPEHTAMELEKGGRPCRAENSGVASQMARDSQNQLNGQRCWAVATGQQQETGAMLLPLSLPRMHELGEDAGGLSFISREKQRRIIF